MSEASEIFVHNGIRYVREAVYLEQQQELVSLRQALQQRKVRRRIAHMLLYSSSEQVGGPQHQPAGHQSIQMLIAVVFVRGEYRSSKYPNADCSCVCQR